MQDLSSSYIHRVRDSPIQILGARQEESYDDLRKTHQHLVVDSSKEPSKNHVRVLLIRHAESEANIDKSEYCQKSDHAIKLTSNGKDQARELGEKVREFLLENKKCGAAHRRIWVSPYKRARDTCKKMLETCGEELFGDLKESIFLGEQQFGLFEGLSTKEIEEQYPNENMHFLKAIRHGGRFWARPPLGESRFDVW